MFKGFCRFSKSVKVLKNTTGHLHSGVQLLPKDFPFNLSQLQEDFLKNSIEVPVVVGADRDAFAATRDSLMGLGG